jgi:hypothetical protein
VVSDEVTRDGLRLQRTFVEGFGLRGYGVALQPYVVEQWSFVIAVEKLVVQLYMR